MHQIMLALNLFYDKYGCLPITSGTTCSGAGTYSQADAGSWDYSSQGGGFMTFLQNSGYIPSAPSDPVNNMTGDGSPAGTFAYRYYCYGNGPSLYYWRESGYTPIAVINHDSNFVCK